MNADRIGADTSNQLSHPFDTDFTGLDGPEVRKKQDVGSDFAHPECVNGFRSDEHRAL